MLEKTNELVECEKLLYSHVSEVSLLGQIELRYSDVEKLRELIKVELWWTNFNDGFEEIKKEYPTCLVCLLVWEGILGYEGGDYWSAVSDSIGTLTVNQKVKMGQFFIDYLKLNNFPVFDIKGSHHYITPIFSAWRNSRILFKMISMEIFYGRLFLVDWKYILRKPMNSSKNGKAILH